ncbi:carcinoembryonic antigen-related cell adhesion molecule 1-like [Rana temporaria]|uniref:carcinoembryonic antigen-related cell adhesion molecule 1-like n=1 Tax=Rana temporaria TaxID=8407 RepID=UPI001AAD48C8|nr:carcinoembryonic antigen-related cell adhesion molecule 1-like [Rana temporaria]
MGYAILTATLLLLIQYGREGAAVTANSNSTLNVLTGNNISLNISYTTPPLTVTWTINGVVQAIWINNSKPQVFQSYADRLSLLENGSLLLAKSTKKDNGSYIATITVVGEPQATLTFQVKIYDPVVNVTVVQSPQVVSGNTAVNLSCKASGDVELVSWTKNGQIVGNSDPYSLLDGNYTLQIKNPDSTYSGNYTCNASNPVSWSDASWGLTIPYTLSGGAIAGIVIGSVAGAILLILLIVLLVFCIRKRKHALGKKKKTEKPQHKDVLRTVSGNTLSPDDPAYFTMNNIMYRNSSISMGSYIMNSTDNTSEHKSPSPNPPSPTKIKHATQV